jgi:2',3'-cyclic-nucleotide 2'-phosphodiesterase (5'-nucleotidase family)
VTGACSERERPAAAQVAKRPAPSLRLVALTDIAGYLEPCGCQSKPLGGIDHAAAKLRALKADHVPVLFVAAGDLLFGPRPDGAASDADAATQETWKAETLVDILNQLGLAAAAPGKRDLTFGAATLEQLVTRSHFKWLPAKPASTAAPEAVAGTLVQAGDIKVGIVGASTFAGPESALPDDRMKAVAAQLQSELDRLRAAGARVTVALLQSDQRTGRRLSATLRGVDFVVQGGLDEEKAAPPSTAGSATLLRAGRQGQGLLVVDVYLSGTQAQAFADVSDWTRRESVTALQTRVNDLHERVAAWERDSQVERASVEEQRGKLRGLQRELEQAKQPAAISGNAFAAHYDALTSDTPSDAPIAGVVDAYDARVNDHNRVAFANVVSPDPPAGAPRYIGSATCQGCHAAAYSWWQSHPHGRAYATLERVHKQFNLSCVGCHVTGYGKPSGATVVNNEGLVNVGCESCHGPGSQHTAQPTAANYKLTTQPGEAVCKTCHTPEHSDLFEFQSYVGRLRVKGHGLPLATRD